MLKLIISVPLLLPLFFQVECLFIGDSCVAEDKAGSCIILSECKFLVAEIENAGSPMPTYMTKRLQKLTCGFDTKKPLVCCVSSVNTQTPSPSPLSISHGMEIPNRGKPISNDDINENRPNLLDNDVWQNVNKNNVNDGPPDIQGHPKLSLLPTTDCGNIEDNKIVGGNKTALFQMPWMVLLSYRLGRETKLSCGGTLINDRYVLTAAHCVSFLGNLKLNGAILGEHDVRRDPDCETDEGVEFCASKIRNVSIDSVIPHSGYNRSTLFDDIALIRLSEPADFALDNVKPLCLPTSPELQKEDLTGQNGIVAGWGVTEIGLQSPVLLSVALPILDNNACMTAYKGSVNIKDTQICAGGIQGKDSCGGDSGGPMMYPGNLGFGGVRYVQRGIVSYGHKRCGIGSFPGVYTKVAYYMDWILDNIRP